MWYCTDYFVNCRYGDGGVIMVVIVMVTVVMVVMQCDRLLSGILVQHN